MSWTEEKVQKLRELWGKDNTASEIAQILGGVSRNAVIGKAHRLNLSSKIKTRSNPQISKNSSNSEFQSTKKVRKNKFKSLLLDSKFEPAKNLSLEELTEDTCKYMEGHPDDSSSSFCGRKTVEKFSYCPLHLMIIYQEKPLKGKKEDLVTKEDDVPKFIVKKIKSA